MLHASVVIVNPGGTGSPAFVISATPAPLPPSKSRILALPSLNKYTHLFGDCFTASSRPERVICCVTKILPKLNYYKNRRMQSVFPDPTPPQLLPCPVRLRQIVPMPPEDHYLTELRCPRHHLQVYTISM